VSRRPQLPGYAVSPADEGDVEAVRALLLEYAASLPFGLDFQGFERELAELPGAYAPPGGALLVARAGGEVVGCVGLRALDGTGCEMKRLYVRRAQRGSGIGRALATAIVTEARRLGYAAVRLDTVPGMERAQALYEELGFRETQAYTDNPVPGARFLELRL
jgi:putative acetyltransferase